MRYVNLQQVLDNVFNDLISFRHENLKTNAYTIYAAAGSYRLLFLILSICMHFQDIKIFKADVRIMVQIIY